MQTNIKELYRKSILPLAEDDQIQLASMILDTVAKNHSTRKVVRKGKHLSELFGTYKGGDPNGSDNDRIDADLSRAYLDTHEEEN